MRPEATSVVAALDGKDIVKWLEVSSHSLYLCTSLYFSIKEANITLLKTFLLY
jgi:hypothetical protein